MEEITYLWKTANQDECTITARRNAQAGFPDRNVEMLTGEGTYSDTQNQLLYEPGQYAQIAAAARRAWRSIAASGELQGQLSKIIQGHNEPYSAFVDRLIVCAGRYFGDVEGAMPLIKQLAFENENKWCQTAIRPWRSKDLTAYIKLCKDINEASITGAVRAAAKKGKVLMPVPALDQDKDALIVANSDTLKHNALRWQEMGCLVSSLGPQDPAQGAVKVGTGLKNAPPSKIFKDDGLIQKTGGGARSGPPRCTEQPCPRRTLSMPLTEGLKSAKQLRFVPRNSPFTTYQLTPSTGEPQESQDWTLVPPPTQY